MYHNREFQSTLPRGERQYNLSRFTDIPETPGKIYGKNPAYVEYRKDEQSQPVKADGNLLTQREQWQRQYNELLTKLAKIQAKREEIAKRIEGFDSAKQQMTTGNEAIADQPAPVTPSEGDHAHESISGTARVLVTQPSNSGSNKGVVKNTNGSNDVPKPAAGETLNDDENRYYQSLSPQQKAWIDSKPDRRRAIHLAMRKYGAI